MQTSNELQNKITITIQDLKNSIPKECFKKDHW